MVFVIALVIAALFSLLCDKALKKHGGAFYIAAVVLAAIAAGCTYAGVTAGFPIWFSTWIWPLVARGALGTALFVVVMVTGALPNGSAAMKKLMPIRGELSIIASILTLGHNITYGKTYFVMLFTQPAMLSGTQLLACISSLVMICIMIPLFITSFKVVRRKMSAKKLEKAPACGVRFLCSHICSHNAAFSADVHARHNDVYGKYHRIYSSIRSIRSNARP